MPPPSQSRSAHLDSVLTGLALYDAYQRRDNDSLTGMVEATPPEEAVKALLASMEVMCGIFAAQLGTDASNVTASVRRRIIRELAGDVRRRPPL